MKKNIRRVFSLVFAVCLVLAAMVPASAELLSAVEPEVEPGVEPRYEGIASLSTNLLISPIGRASCCATVYDKGDYELTVTIELQQDGTTIKSWELPTERGFNSYDKTYYVTSGHDYQEIVTVTLRLNGIYVRSYSASSAVVTY